MQQNKILFFNIGNRDVKINGEVIDKNEIRSKGKEILNNFEEYKDKISIELVKPIIEEFKNETEKIYLFVTNQEDRLYKGQDTLYLGEIIKKVVEEDYGIECEIKQYIFNPTHYNLVFDYFVNFFRDFDDSKTKIISTSGGVPAMKFGILIVATTLFNNLEVYSLDEKTNEVRSVDYQNTLKKEFIKKSALEFLDRHNYGAIIDLLEKNNLGDKRLHLLLKYANSRLNFNFERSNVSLNEFMEQIPSIEKERYEELAINFSDGENLDFISLISELFSNMVIKWDNKDYIDFVGRLYRFNETIPQIIFEKETDQKIDWESREEGNKQFMDILTGYPELENKIRDKSNINKDEKIKANAQALEICFNYFVEKNGSEIGPVYDIYNKIKSTIDETRHYTIVAHGFKGISKKDIFESYGNDHLIEDLEKVTTQLNKGYVNPFDSINNILKEHIVEL